MLVVCFIFSVPLWMYIVTEVRSSYLLTFSTSSILSVSVNLGLPATILMVMVRWNVCMEHCGKLTLRIRRHHMPLAAWEKQLAPTLSNLRSLVCQSTGRTPHSLFLGFPRRSPFMVIPKALPLDNSPQSCETDVPDWLHVCRSWCTSRLGSTQQGWSIGGASSDTGGGVSSYCVGVISIWSLWDPIFLSHCPMSNMYRCCYSWIYKCSRCSTPTCVSCFISWSGPSNSV